MQSPTVLSQYKSKAQLVFIAATAALGGFNIGIVCCILNATLLQIQTSLKWPQDELDFRLGVASSLIPLGSFIGAMLSGYLSDKIGRRRSLMTGDIIILGGFLFTYCENFLLFCFGRVVEGIACGTFGVLVPAYIREITPPEISGKMTSAYSIFCNIAGILMYLITFALPLTPTVDDQVWKIMYAIPAVVAGLQLLIFGLVWKHDTPKYYLIKNNEEKARAVIDAIYHENSADDAFDKELRVEKSVAFFDIIKNYKYQLFICMTLYFTTQYMGLGMLGYYSTYIFLGTNGGQTQNSEEFIFQVRLLNLFLSVAGFPIGLCGSYLVDKLGRRLLLLVGCVTVTVLLFSFGYFGIEDAGLPQRICFILLNIANGMTYGVMVSLYTAELVPPKGISIINTWDNMHQLIITFFFPVIVNTPAKMSMAFIVFGLVAVLSFPFKWYFVKETKNKTLHEIYQVFKKKKNDTLLHHTPEDAKHPELVSETRQ